MATYPVYKMCVGSFVLYRQGKDLNRDHKWLILATLQNVKLYHVIFIWLANIGKSILFKLKNTNPGGLPHMYHIVAIYLILVY